MLKNSVLISMATKLPLKVGPQVGYLCANFWGNRVVHVGEKMQKVAEKWPKTAKNEWFEMLANRKGSQSGSIATRFVSNKDQHMDFK